MKLRSPWLARACCGAALVAGFAAPASADLFEVIAESTSGPPVTADAAGSSIIDLVEDLVDSEGEFLSLEDEAFDASLTYGGIEDAILVSRNAAGTEATVTIPSTGFTRTFTGDDPEDLEDQIVDFLLEEGQAEYARFLREVNENSPIGVIDGNPLAATNLLAEHQFANFGIGRGGTQDWDTGLAADVDRRGLKLDVAGGFDSNDEGDGSFATAGLARVWRFSSRVGLAYGATFTYREIENADVFHFGSHIGLPIVIVGPDAGGFVWQVTPSFHAGASGSDDLAAGGTLLGGSVTSSLRIPIGSRLALTIGNQLSFFEGYKLEAFGYEWDTDASQQVLKNGVRLSYLVFDQMFVDASITHTALLEDAFLDDWISPGAGVGFFFSDRQRTGLRLAYRGDFGDDYDVHGGSASLFFNY